MYESIVKGEYRLEPGLPESFNVLVKELQGLALDFTMSEDEMAGELTEEDLAEQVVRAAQARESASSSLDAADALFSREALGASSDDDEDDDSDEDDEDGEEEEDL